MNRLLTAFALAAVSAGLSACIVGTAVGTAADVAGTAIVTTADVAGSAVDAVTPGEECDGGQDC